MVLYAVIDHADFQKFRAKSADQIASEFLEMYIEIPVEQWENQLRAADQPPLRLVMCGYFSTLLSILYDPEIVDELVEYLLGAFDLSDDIKVFCLQEFLPEMRSSLNISQVRLTPEEFFKLEANGWGTAFKLIYAFLWQVLLV